MSCSEMWALQRDNNCALLSSALSSPAYLLDPSGVAKTGTNEKGDFKEEPNEARNDLIADLNTLFIEWSHPRSPRKDSRRTQKERHSSISTL